MKTLILGLAVFFGLTSQAIAQKGEISRVELKDIYIHPINASYFEEVYNANTPNHVKALERRVANFNVKESEAFGSTVDSYLVTFEAPKSDDGKIIATFDKKGMIMKSLEKYHDILLPNHIRKELVKIFPGWALTKSMYVVHYNNDKDTNKMYQVQIRKGNAKKNLIFNTSGESI